MNILITGVSRGLGRHIVKELMQTSGHSVIGLSRDREALIGLRKEVSSRSGGSVFYGIQADVSETGQIQRVREQMAELADSLDAMVNNAGVLVHKPFGMYTPDDFDKVFTTNLKAPFFLAQEFLPLMKHGSHILNIGSMGGVQGSLKFPGLSLYSASKGALSVWTESLAAELSEKGIHVNCIAPGSIDTEMFAEAFPGAAASFTASQAAAFISFFITSGYRYFNGKILPLSVTTP